MSSPSRGSLPRVKRYYPLWSVWGRPYRDVLLSPTCGLYRALVSASDPGESLCFSEANFASPSVGSIAYYNTLPVGFSNFGYTLVSSDIDRGVKSTTVLSAGSLNLPSAFAATPTTVR